MGKLLLQLVECEGHREAGGSPYRTRRYLHGLQHSQSQIWGTLFPPPALSFALYPKEGREWEYPLPQVRYLWL